MRIIACLLLLALAAPARAAPADEVQKLDWMFGTWRADKDGATTLEAWIGPREGVMSGVGQTTAPGKRASFEYLKISAEPAGATLTALLPGQKPVAFPLASAKDGEVVFENKAHDFPQRIIYWRCDGNLCARIEGTLKGKLEFEEWRFLPVR